MTSVVKTDVEGRARLHCMSENGRVFTCTESETILEKKWEKPKPGTLDWRGIREGRRTEIAKDLAISMIEKVEKGKLLEDLQVEAILYEIKMRVGCPSKTLVVPPSMGRVFGREKFEPLSLSTEERTWHENIKEARHAFICVHSEAPQHYTALEIHKNEAKNEWRIEFRDSLKAAPETAVRAAKAILENLGFVDKNYELPKPSNKTHQADGWSCGIWTSNSIERGLR